MSMARANYSPDHKEVLDSFLLKMPGVVPGKMFGYPAYYTNGKLFACLYEGGVGIKVPEELAEELIGKEGMIHFQPLGRRKMKEWVRIDRKGSMDYLKDRGIFERSVEFVSSLKN